MIQIQVWADFECPYSYFQTIVLEKLQARYQERLEIVWRAFELTPVEGNILPTQSYIDNLEASKSEPIVVQENLELLTPKTLSYTWLAQESVYFANSQGLSLMADEQEFKTYGFQGLPAMLIGEKDFSPRSFMPITGYKTVEELLKILPR